MTAPQTDAAPEAAALAETFTNEVNEYFGDHAPAREPDEAPPSEGTPPAAADPAPDTAKEADAPDGGAEVEPKPSEGTPPAAATDDPWKDAVPATYVVHGKTIPVEDIKVFPQGGAVIAPESLPNILAKLAERDTLSERVRTRDAEYQTLSKVTEWTDPEGKQFTGPEAAIELRIRATELLAENQLLVEHLTDPDKLYSLLTTELVPDGKGGQVERVILSPKALLSLQTQNELRNLKASNAVREHYKGVMAAQTPETPVDFVAIAPDLIQRVATEAKLDASVLTASDKTMLAKHLPFHTSKGLASREWQDLVKDRIQDRLSQKSSAKTVVDTTTKAVKEGQARMAAAARGVKKPVAAPVVPVKKPTQESERATNQSDAWDMLEQASARTMRSAR